MATSHPLPPEFLDHMMKIFYVICATSKGGNNKYYNISGVIRKVDHWSRQTFNPDVAAQGVDDAKVDYFKPTDANSTTPTDTGPFILAEEPAFEFGQSTNGTTYLAIMAHNFLLDSEAIAQSGAPGILEVNPAMEVFESAYASFFTGATKIGGPIRVGEALGGSRAARNSVDAAGSGNVMGPPLTDRTYALEASPLVIDPLTTLNPRINVEGSRFADLGVTERPRLTWNLKMLVADGAYNLNEPRIPTMLQGYREMYAPEE